MKRRLVCILLAIILLLSCGIGVMMNVSAANEDDRTFFSLGSAASAAFASTLYDNGSMSFDAVNGSGGSSVIGNYGSVLGYTSGEDGVIMGWIASATSTAQSDVSYAALQTINGIMVGDASEDDGTEKSAVWYYCQYGYMLSDLGLDKTGTNGMHPVKFISGFMLMIAYVCSLIVPVVFKGILLFLSWLNPFKLFYDLVEIKSDALIGGKASAIAPPGVLRGLSSQISTWYAWFQSFSEYIVIPALFVSVILTLLFTKHAGQRGGAVRKFVTRMFIIFLCVPICGLCYTTALTQMSGNVDQNFAKSSKIIQSTLVDFERWAQTSHLRPFTELWMNDSDTEGQVGTATETTAFRIRNIAYSINAHGGSADTAGIVVTSDDLAILQGAMAGLEAADVAFSSASSLASWNTLVQSGSSSVDVGSISDVLSLITRHMTAEFYSASDFESYAKSLISTSGISTDDVDGLWDVTNEAKKFKDDKNFRFDDKVSDSLSKGALNIWGDGCLVTNGKKYFCQDRGFVDASGYTQIYGLSTMSMYNYLNTKFAKTGATMYTVDSSSDFVRESHYSVNLIGNGVMSFLYWCDAFVMLAAVTLVGLCYAISMLVGNVKRGLKFITSVPFALLGGLQAGARIITYTAMMLIEIIGTFWIYDLVTSILLSLSSIIEAPIEGFIRQALAASPTVAGGGEGVVLSSVMIIAVMLIDIIIVIAFTVMAIRLRKALLKSFDEMAENVIEKFIVNPTQPHGMSAPPPPPGGNLKGGLAQGAGLAAMAQRGRNGNGAGANGQTQGVKGTAKAVGSADGSSGTSISGMGQQGDMSGEGSLMPTGPNGLPGGADGTGLGASGSADMLGGAPGSAAAAGGAGASGAAASGGAGAGAGAGMITNAAFADNNAAQADKSMGEKLLGGDHLERHKKHKQQQEMNDRAFLAEAMGQVGATNEEAADEQAAEARKEVHKQQVMAATQAVVGVAEVAGAAFTGDVSLAQDGVKNVANGVGGMRDANENLHDIKADESSTKLDVANERQYQQQYYKDVAAQEQAIEERRAEENYAKSQAAENSNVKNVSSMDQTVKQNSSSETNGTTMVQSNVKQTNNQKQLSVSGKSSTNTKSLAPVSSGSASQQQPKQVRAMGSGQQSRPSGGGGMSGQRQSGQSTQQPVKSVKPVSSGQQPQRSGGGSGGGQQTTVKKAAPATPNRQQSSGGRGGMTGGAAPQVQQQPVPQVMRTQSAQQPQAPRYSTSPGQGGSFEQTVSRNVTPDTAYEQPAPQPVVKQAVPQRTEQTHTASYSSQSSGSGSSGSKVYKSQPMPSESFSSNVSTDVSSAGSAANIPG